jgi:hypothetical protein
VKKTKMAVHYIVYGFKSEDLDGVADQLAKLGIEWELHESFYYGLYYLYKDLDKHEKLQLINNYFDYEGEWQEPKFKDSPVVLRVTAMEKRAEEIGKLVQAANATLLRQKEFDR